MVSSIGGAFGHSISPGILDYYLESYLFILAITTLEKEFLLFTQLFYCYFYVNGRGVLTLVYQFD